jgi:hypothetical protein
MEKQSSSDLVPMRLERTSTSTDGASQSLGIPLLKTIWQEPGAALFMVELGGTLTLHTKIEGKITLSRIKHFRDIMDNLVLHLIDRGMDHLDTWVQESDVEQLRFAETFGFRETGYLKIVDMGEERFELIEMRLEFPKLEEE